MLEQGWPSNAALDNNQTALHYAAWALHGSLHSWERDKGDYVGVTRALLAAGAAIPKPEHPLEAAEDVLAILKQHAP